MPKPTWTGAIAAAALSLACNAASQAQSASLVCTVTKKMDSERTYSKADLDKWQFRVEVVQAGDTTIIRRCSFSSIEARVTCDNYEADYVATDRHIGVQKFYHYSSQFDFQVFKDGSFIENNGRGSFGFGTCK